MIVTDPRSLVAPGHDRRADGTLTIGGVGADVIADTYGTAAFVIDLNVFDANVRAFVEAAAPHGIEVAYAAKAFLVTALAQRLIATPLALDVCSLGEIVTGEAAGFPAERMYLHGCGKSEEELEAAIDGRVGAIVVDNLDELRLLAAAADPVRPVRIFLRLNVGIEAHTHAYVRTGGENTKFGIALGDLADALEIVRGANALVLAGLHSHLGSQIAERVPYEANLLALLDAAAVCARAGMPVGHLILGGGFAVDEDPQTPLWADLPAFFAGLAESAARGAAEREIPVPSLGVEPGRALIATAGTSLYRVAALKTQGNRRFVVIDGGIADNPRPALYGAYHQPIVARSGARSDVRAVTVCGRSCENDVLVDAALPDDLAIGDLVALCTTGAYTYSMASNYNRFGRPPVVFVRNGSHRLAARRESALDLLRNDVRE